MKFSDYLWLGFAGVKAHKKRAFAVVIIVGLLFGVLMAGAFILQGSENAVLGEMLAPTDGEVIVMSSVESRACGEGCDLVTEAERMRKKVEEYGGEVIGAEVMQVNGERFYKLEEGVFRNVDSNDGDVVQVAVPLKVAVGMTEMKLPDSMAGVAKQVQAVTKARGEILEDVFTDENGDRCQVVEILPGSVYTWDLSFYNVKQKNLLDVIFGSINTGTSLNFIVGGVATEAMAMTKVEDLGMVLARFPSIESADNYYRDKVNYCGENDRLFDMCGKEYRYQTVAAISDPLGAYEKFQDIWSAFKIVAAALAVIGAIITLSTYARLIGRDMKIVSLYHAMGATGWQVRMVYLVYLLMLSAMAVGFAVVVGLVLAVVVSFVNMTALGQLFVLGFGVAEKGIWLVGWNNLVWWLVGVMVMAVIVTVVANGGQFKVRELAKRMK